MEKCINCKKETEKKYEFYVVRIFKTKENNKKVKKEEIAGNIIAYLCDDCLNKNIKDTANFTKSFLRMCIIPFILLGMSISTLFLGNKNANPITSGILFSLVAIYCIYTGYKEAKTKSDEIKRGMTNKLKRKMISDLVVINLPSKDKKGKLYYVMSERAMSDNHKELSEEIGISENIISKIKRLKKNEEKGK